MLLLISFQREDRVLFVGLRQEDTAKLCTCHKSYFSAVLGSLPVALSKITRDGIIGGWEHMPSPISVC